MNRRIAGGALTLLLLISSGCAADEAVDQPKPSAAPLPEPTASQTPPPTQPPAADPYEGWAAASFAFGFGELRVPSGADIRLLDSDHSGNSPRWAGGSIAVFARPEQSVGVSLHPAGSQAWMNDVVCATEVIGSFPGAARISETNKIWFMSTLYMGYRYGMLRMAETAPIGENCEKLFDVPVAGGWAVQASAQTAIDTASAEADVLVWVESDAVQEVIKIMQSLSVS